MKVTPSAYVEQLNEAVTKDRELEGKKPLKCKEDKPCTKPTKVSRTDPDSGFMVRDEKPKGFFYLDHRIVDGRHGIIVDTHATPGNVHDSQPIIARIDRARDTFKLNHIAVGLDAGYFTAAVCHHLEARQLIGVMGYRRPTKKKATSLNASMYTTQNLIHTHAPKARLLLTTPLTAKATASITLMRSNA